GHPPVSPVLDCAPAGGRRATRRRGDFRRFRRIGLSFSAETFRRPVSGASMILPTKLGFALSALVIASGVVALPPASSAQEADQALPPPRWSVPPQASVDDFPEAALQADVSGAAVIACDAAPDGRPVNCEVRSETPQGMGFGPAALGIVPRRRVVVSDDGADAASRRFAVRVPFNLAPGPPPQEPARTLANIESRWLTPPQPKASDYP